ncbi:MAG: hypothetical protein HKN85_02330 [Gammaproteobacteria bacterium]|nr:hypothetical protein [Gammaproteobacteria bacterium]
MKYSKLIRSIRLHALLVMLFSGGVYGADAQRKTITGEVLDTWCCVTQIMGASDFVVGTTHHVCAVWCAAGGIPGLLDKCDGKIYMIEGAGDDTISFANERLLDLQSREITMSGSTYELDGSSYLMVDEFIEDHGVSIGRITTIRYVEKSRTWSSDWRNCS